MKPLTELCTPRASVFHATRSSGALDLSNFITAQIDPHHFFAENYITAGMRRLFTHAFRRFLSQSEQGVFVLTQQMGGGKTHSMIALGLLAQYPAMRSQVLATIPDMPDTRALGAVRVIAFNGRESDAPLGIWGTLAKQLGKQDQFNAYYSPLQAPGQTAWIELLRGDPVLILLDELPPYFDNARSRAIGNSDLANVTTTALANLLVAVSKQELANVCVVISDLRATYEGGSQQIVKALDTLQQEVKRSALQLEPVAMNTDEIYHILRTRLFEQLPALDSPEVQAIATAYAHAVRDASQMDITTAKPDETYRQICASYPFHYALRDLYARFRENEGFQQTRGLLRLMRALVARLFDPTDVRAAQQYLIHAHDFDLNDRDTLTEITEVNTKLGNAIAHDIASLGGSVAEQIDAERATPTTDAQDAARLLLVASLSNVPNAIRGLNLSDTIHYLCAPHREIARLPREVLEPLRSRAWYLHADAQGRFLFKDQKNLIAELNDITRSYGREQSARELRTFLNTIFTPKRSDCYQRVLPLPALDEIQPEQDKVLLVIVEPAPTGGLPSDVTERYARLDYKNRLLFLTGTRATLDKLLDIAAELKAIQTILDNFRAEKVPDTDPNTGAARDLHDRIRTRLLSTARETFTSLYYPSRGGELRPADFQMNFTDNHYNGEDQIRATLLDKEKFTEDISSETFRKKCEQRLFTQQEMTWSEVLRRAATTPEWPWHHPRALNDLRDRMRAQDFWREQGTLLDKGPFPPPTTSVQIRQRHRDPQTGEVTLELQPMYGDTIHYEIGAGATSASARVSTPETFKTTALELSFICVDSSGTNPTGAAKTWYNTIEVKHRFYQDGNQYRCALHAVPDAPIRYTTDGSDPRELGGSYAAPFLIEPATRQVAAVAAKGIVRSEVRFFPVPAKPDEVSVDRLVPATFKRKLKTQATADTFAQLALLTKHAEAVSDIQTTVSTAAGQFVECVSSAKLHLTPAQVEATIEHLRGLLGSSLGGSLGSSPAGGQVTLAVECVYFATGQHLLDWVAEIRTTLKPGEVEQVKRDP
ncbi:MAG: DUF499 domain-containing protein [Chloroflexaceae bacterium]|nr:DUF499 domain-containing protein [Chloroflexaceae bacterium]